MQDLRIQSNSASLAAKVKLFELTPDLLCIVSMEGKFEVLNDAFSHALGYGHDELLQSTLLELVHPEDQASAKAELDRIREGYCSIQFENRLIRKDGAVVYISWTSYPDLDDELIYVVARDISARTETQTELLKSNEMLRALNQAQSAFIHSADRFELFSALLDTILQLTGSEYGFIGEVLSDEDGKPYLKTHAITDIAWNTETQKLYDEFAAQGMEFRNLETLFGRVMTTGKPVIANDAPNDPRGGGVPKGHPSLKRFLGLPFHIGSELVGMAGIANRADGYDAGLIQYLEPFLATCANLVHGYRNQHERREAEADLRFLATTDGLTGLPNRRKFLVRLREEADRAIRHHIPLSLLMVDLDHFKDVNDTYGHDCGDIVLGVTADILRDSCRSIDLPARLGGEEFAILLPQTKKAAAAHIAERVRATMEEQEFASPAGNSYSVSCSVGVAEFKGNGDDIDALIKRADQALYWAKENGRNRVGGI